MAIRAAALLDQYLSIDVPLIVLVAPITVFSGLAEAILPSERSRMRSLFGGPGL